MSAFIHLGGVNEAEAALKLASSLLIGFLRSIPSSQRSLPPIGPKTIGTNYEFLLICIIEHLFP